MYQLETCVWEPFGIFRETCQITLREVVDELIRLQVTFEARQGVVCTFHNGCSNNYPRLDVYQVSSVAAGDPILHMSIYAVEVKK